MSPLGQLVDSAVAAAIAEHPKLFAATSKDRAQKTIVRAIMKSLVRETRDSTDEQPTESVVISPPVDWVLATDPHAIAYCELRKIAGAVAPMRQGDKIYFPAESNRAAVYAFRDCPPRSAWIFIKDPRQLAAWREFFEEMMPGVTRRQIIDFLEGSPGRLLPWAWPPAKSGKVYAPPSDEEIDA